MSHEGKSPTPRVLVVYKKSALRIYVDERKHVKVAALLARRDPAVAGMLRAHRDHERTLLEARRTLAALGVKAVFRHRSDRGEVAGFDLIVTLGGDGTLLWASHGVGAGPPVLAINSAPRDSVGYFCAATREGLGDALSDALAGRLRETRLTRMRVKIDDEVVSSRVLNDVLFSHLCPAATTRYSIRLRGRQEEHKSSGVWVATAAGSTAAIRSAGGRRQALSSTRLQFLVREPYVVPPHHVRLLEGFFGGTARLTIRSHVRQGRLYLDGPHHARQVEIGSEVVIGRSAEPLSLLGLQRR
jgi:NAD+ kinase